MANLYRHGSAWRDHVDPQRLLTTDSTIYLGTWKRVVQGKVSGAVVKLEHTHEDSGIMDTPHSDLQAQAKRTQRREHTDADGSRDHEAP